LPERLALIVEPYPTGKLALITAPLVLGGSIFVVVDTVLSFYQYYSVRRSYSAYVRFRYFLGLLCCKYILYLCTTSRMEGLKVKMDKVKLNSLLNILFLKLAAKIGVLRNA
jgi:hypothetical protein